MSLFSCSPGRENRFLCCWRMGTGWLIVFREKYKQVSREAFRLEEKPELEKLPGKRDWRSPAPAVCTPPPPPWFPSCRCTPSPTPESRSSPPGPPHDPRTGYGRRSAEAGQRDGYVYVSFKTQGSAFSLKSTNHVESNSLGCGSPSQERCTWPRHLPRGCSRRSPGWSSTRSETFQSRSIAPRSCGQRPLLQGHSKRKGKSGIYLGSNKKNTYTYSIYSI